jgi:tetratricopeptide (TPR) repeat protein
MAATQKTAKVKTKGPDRGRPRPAPPAQTAFQPELLWTAALLVGAVLIVYFPALSGKFLWDDAAHVTRANLRSLYGLWRIWFDLGATQQYYPLLHSAFWFEHKLWGDASAGYHLINILLHAADACLLLLILRRLKIPGAALAAALFALHPVYVESVAWITEQKNTLSALFYFSAALVYLRFDVERRAALYGIALALFVLGLLTKTVTATLPGALLVVFWWQHGRLSWRRDVTPLLPWFALGAVAGLFTAWVERALIGAQGAPFEFTLAQRFLLAGRVIWFYLGKLIWPADLLFIYPRWEVDPAAWWQYLFPLAAVALTGTLWVVRERVRAPLAGFLFFIGSLFPVLGFFNVYPFIFSFVADHFQYLASVGIIVVVAAATAATLERAPPRAGQAACAIVLALLAFLTWRQSRMYRDPIALYQATLVKNPGCWMCSNNIGMVLADSGRQREAIPYYEQTLRIRPDLPQAHNNLGNALFQTARAPEALGHYQEALRLKPNYFEAHNNLGAVLSHMGMTAEAQKEFEAALRLNPDFTAARENLVDIYNQLGNTLLQTGLASEAVEYYRRALKLGPDSVEAHNNLGVALFRMGRMSEAKREYEAALRLKPDFAAARANLSALQTSPAGRQN